MTAEKRRDSAHFLMTNCEECGKSIPDYDAYQRRGVTYCTTCAWNTADKRAYERWFVDPNS